MTLKARTAYIRLMALGYYFNGSGWDTRCPTPVPSPPTSPSPTSQRPIYPFVDEAVRVVIDALEIEGYERSSVLGRDDGVVRLISDAQKTIQHRDLERAAGRIEGAL